MPAKKHLAGRLRPKASKNPAQKKTTAAASKKPAPNSTGQYPAASPTAASAARALPPKSPSPSPTLRVKRPLPAKSVQKAADAFKKFSLSRFAQSPTPANYVPTAQAKRPSAVVAVQRTSVTTQMASLAANPPRTLGMSVALTPTSLAQLLPSLDAKTGTVGLAELLAVLQQNLRGKQFYATGNPTLNLVVQNFTLLSQVRAYMSALKAGPGGSSTAVGTPGTTPDVFKPSQERQPDRKPLLERTKVSRSPRAAAAKRRTVATKKGGA